ncbi:MAG: ATP-binding protein [Planctomycetaceae bacterium]|jgi:predicted AAA+ superfamily ATPase|nr:ATP-binding protein [Planctomycetaceae bacterium]
MQKLRDLKDAHLIKVVTGLRRAGKSTLLEMFADEIRLKTPDASILFLNFENPDIFTIGDWKQIYDYVKVRLVADRMNYVFLDEIQNIPTFERLVDGLFIKKNVDLYITGSNSQLLSGELATLLTGRYVETEILPFSFAEWVESYENSPKLTKNASLANFLQNGAIPQAVTLSMSTGNNNVADSFVQGVLNTIVEKDIFKRHGINNKTAFYKILDFVFDSVGSILSPRSISDTLRSNNIVVDKLTVTNYLNYLTEAFILYKVPRYDVKGKRLLQTLDKYYLADTSFRRIRLGKKTAEDRGHLLENVVYLELRRRYNEVYVGKTRNNEIDFVASDSGGYVSYYQVAYSVLDEKTLKRELTPLKEIRDSNPKFLLSADEDINPVFDGIRKLNVVDWLLGRTNKVE